MPKLKPATLCATLYAVLLSTPAVAAPVDFVREVRPIFEEHCHDCHGADKQKSGFRIDLKDKAFRSGDKHSPNLIAGKASESPLIHFITTDDEDERMPPKGEHLSSREIDILTRWINEGAVWPDGIDVAEADDRTDHWSFKPLQTASASAEPPSIDSFIDAKLEEKNLQRSPPADAVSLIRRITFDLTGLPPAPKEVDEFQSEQIRNPQSAIRNLIDRLLASSRYGEHWAQHWLDVVRYADTHGFEVNTERPNAWPYRDYVIRAFNDDTPYNQFIKEQIVGDALGQDAATGFLVTASVLLPGQIGKDEPSKRLARQDSIDEIVTNIGQTFLGLSIGCARCHDHKFDPITARDYYSMQAFVAGVEYGDRDLRTPAALAARKEAERLKSRLTEIDHQLAAFVPLAQSGTERPMVNFQENVDRFSPVKTQRLRFTVRATMSDNLREPCIDELEVFTTDGKNLSPDAAVTSSGDTIVADRHDLKYLNDGEYGNSRSWMSNEKGGGWVILEFASAQTIDRVVWGRDRLGKFKDRLAIDYQIEVTNERGEWTCVADSSDRRPFDSKDKTEPAFTTAGLRPDEAAAAKALMAERKPLEARVNAATSAQKAFAGTFRTPDDIHLLNRGDPEQPVEPVVPAVLSSLGKLELASDADEQKRRLALADWIASPTHPLTARVMVNRIWQGHFGIGLVETASDFGRMGTPPTHPELLDWLAAEFIDSGWSVKHMHRLIMMSQTYRQSCSTGDNKANKDQNPDPLLSPLSPVQIDADARLLWRYPGRRLEAESIRDSMLAVSGQLNPKMYGRGYDLFDKRGGLSGFTPVEHFIGDGLRRMIYAHKVRRETEAVFGAFDCPDAGQSTARRIESTTPIQALNLFNSPFTLDQAAAFAERVKSETGNNQTAQIHRAYQLALSRNATPEELADALPLIEANGLAILCRALFNSNEFLFVP